MIIDILDNAEKYAGIIPKYPEIKEYLEKHDIGKLPSGRYPIVRDEVYLLVQEYVTEEAEAKYWESHRKYIDIHCLLEGEETIGYSSEAYLKQETEYDTSNDAVLFEKSETGTSLWLHEKMFCVFFPGEAHMPGCAAGIKKKVRKIVIKIHS